MKQFSLEEFKKNPNRKVVTRDGRPVRIVCSDAKGDYPVVGLAIDEDGSEYTIRCTQYGISGFTEDDLFIDSAKMQAWVNLYRNDEGVRYLGYLRETEEAAFNEVGTKNYMYKRIATFKVEWEE